MRLAAPDELRAVCWNHNDCPGAAICACPCHTPRRFPTPQHPDSTGTTGAGTQETRSTT